MEAGDVGRVTHCKSVSFLDAGVTLGVAAFCEVSPNINHSCVELTGTAPYRAWHGRAAFIQRAQPRGKVTDCQRREDRPARHPHDDPGQLLVLQRGETPGGRQGCIVGIPGAAN